MGQEAGHRWLAFLEFRDHTGQRSDALLGRDLAHWSFFFDSDASVMEGNDIQDLGGGSFRTVGAVQRYSLLDQYAMGLVPDTAVPPFFYVESPMNMSAVRTRDPRPRSASPSTAPAATSSSRTCIAIEGPRFPRAADSPKVHRQAFVYVPTAGQIRRRRTDRRSSIGSAAHGKTFFLQATDERMKAVTTLR